MNAKTCKKLRKEAKKYSSTQLDKAEYKRTGANHFFTGQVTLVPNCFRAVYQEAKKVLKSGYKPFSA